MIILLIGIAIGFMGYLMVNNINLSIIEIKGENKKTKLTIFIILALLLECIYCFFSLYGLQFLMDYPTIILTAQYVSVAFLFILGLWSLLEQPKNQTQMRENIIRRGYWSIFVHPQQIPFWFFWGIILIKKEYLHTDSLSLIVFALANAAGSLLILLGYAAYGNKIISMLNVKRKHLKNLVGIVCLSSACFLLYDILKAA